MKQDCLDIGLIQAFMDGELDHAQVDRVSGHIAVCDQCAMMLSEAEDESAVVFPALEREYNTLVPTQRLWNKINDSITEERQSRPFWQKAWAYVSFGVMTPSLVAAASLLIVVGISALMLVNRQQAPVQNAPMTASVRPSNITPPSPTAALPRGSDDAIVPDQVSSVPTTGAYRVERADYRQTAGRGALRTTRVDPPAPADASTVMPGEESYVKTIASLSRSVDEQKDDALRGAERVSFERDMAVVNDAITKMRAEVKKDPKNESAKQVLYSSYQNKIDLLSSISQKEELVASLK